MQSGIGCLPLMCDKGDTENVFYMLAAYQLRLSVNRVVFLCRGMQPLRPAHSPNLDTRCHHLSYFDIEKCALNGEVKTEKIRKFQLNKLFWRSCDVCEERSISPYLGCRMAEDCHFRANVSPWHCCFPWQCVVVWPPWLPSTHQCVAMWHSSTSVNYFLLHTFGSLRGVCARIHPPGIEPSSVVPMV